MSTSPAPYIEPWLRGTHADVSAVGRGVLHAFDLALDDISKWTEGLTDLEVHARPHGLSAVAFHLRHIARSTDRLLTYAEGGQLSADQLGLLKAELDGKRDAGGVAGGGRGLLQQRCGSREGARDCRLQHFSRRRAQAAADVDRWSAGSCGRSHAAARGPGGNDGEGAEGAAELIADSGSYEATRR